MKWQHFSIALLMLAGVGCSPTPKAEKQQNVKTETKEDTKQDVFVWPDSLALTKDTNIECYYDQTLRKYATDTSIFAKEEEYIEDQLAFVSHYTLTIVTPREWKNDPMLSKMVDYYNFMGIAHAVETDLDAFDRYEGEFDEEEKNTFRLSLKKEYRSIGFDNLNGDILRAKIKDIIEWALSDDEARAAMDSLPNSPTDISEIVAQLTDDWMNELPDDSLEQEKIGSRAIPQSYLPAWVPDIYTYFVGQESQPTERDKQEVFKRFMAAESFDEKAAWGFVAMGMQMPFEMLEVVIKEVEVMLSSGCYSPLLDPLWRAYRTQYNTMYTCPSTYCYSPNLRYNHFRRMIAYVTMRHIEAHPEDLQARLQYYFMVAHTNILRFNPNPLGNSSAYEFLNLYWSHAIIGY